MQDVGARLQQLEIFFVLADKPPPGLEARATSPAWRIHLEDQDAATEAAESGGEGPGDASREPDCELSPEKRVAASSDPALRASPSPPCPCPPAPGPARHRRLRRAGGIASSQTGAPELVAKPQAKQQRASEAAPPETTEVIQQPAAAAGCAAPTAVSEQQQRNTATVATVAEAREAEQHGGQAAAQAVQSQIEAGTLRAHRDAPIQRLEKELGDSMKETVHVMEHQMHAERGSVDEGSVVAQPQSTKELQQPAAQAAPRIMTEVIQQPAVQASLPMATEEDHHSVRDRRPRPTGKGRQGREVRSERSEPDDEDDHQAWATRLVERVLAGQVRSTKEANCEKWHILQRLIDDHQAFENHPDILDAIKMAFDHWADP